MMPSQAMTRLLLCAAWQAWPRLRAPWT